MFRKGNVGFRCGNRGRNGRSPPFRRRFRRKFLSVRQRCRWQIGICKLAFAIASACALNLYSVYRQLSDFMSERNISLGRCGRFNENAEAKEMACVLSIEPFLQHQLISVMPCGDMHHANCLYKWLTTLGRKKSCPKCNQDVNVLAKVSSLAFFTSGLPFFQTQHNALF